MNSLGVLLLAAVTATGGLVKPSAHKHWLRSHVVADGPGAWKPRLHVRPPRLCGRPACPGNRGAGGPGGQPGGASRTSAARSSSSTRPDEDRLADRRPVAASAVYLPAQLTVPARYNFTQGYIYRLKITDIPGRTTGWSSTRRSRSPPRPRRPTPT